MKLFFTTTRIKFSGALPGLRLRKITALLLCFCLGAYIQPASAQEELLGLTTNSGPEGKGTLFSLKTNNTGFNIIKGFADWGNGPLGNLVKGTDGALYGTTYQGGTYGYGTIFKISTTGALKVLKHFDLTNDGGYPKGSLLLAKDGNFYGYTSSGSINNGGAIFKITPAGVYSIVRSLSINTDGGRPQGTLVQATDGNFYGINNAGGVNGYGTIFRLTPTGTYTVLKVLSKADGGNSYGSLIQAKDGNLYGMSYWGGTANYGIIFRITLTGTYTVLRSLASATDGAYPYGDLLEAKDGSLYGMTSSGGINYNGTIFKITTTGTFTVVRSLNTSTDGGSPTGNLVQATDGNFYGMTKYSGGGTYGAIFKLTTTGVYTVLKKLDLTTTGGYPNGSLFANTDGYLYAMTNQGGSSFYGTIFKINTAGTFTLISAINGAAQGNEPQENLVTGKDSALYGLTRYGGVYNYGTVFKVCGGVTSVLRSFNKTTDGANPSGALLRATDGNFYGMTETGGTNSVGTIFKITPTGGYTVLRQLKTATDGAYPKGSLVQGPDGALYGMTSTGGTGSGGTIFKITTAGVFTVLRNLVSTTDGSAPEGSLVVAKDGNLYGLTSYNSRFFKITPAGVFTVIKTLTYGTDGNGFTGALVPGNDSTFYGNNSTGGRSSGGTIFKITRSGVLTVLRTLAPTTDGSAPKGTLAMAADGNFYGVTTSGGTYKAGTLFRISSTGTFTVFRHFNLLTDGGAPSGGLIIGPKNGLIANAQKNIAVTEDKPKAIVLTGNGSSLQQFNITVAPKNGTLTGTGANRTYTPKANYYGVDSFYYTVSLGCISSAPAVISFVITQVNDTPVLASIGNKTIAKSKPLTFTATATDVDAGQTKTYTLITPPSGAAINATSGVFTWTPAATGTFTFKVRVTDNGSPVLYDEETITVTVTATLTARETGEETKLSTPADSIVNVPVEKLYPNPVSGVKCTIALNEDIGQLNTSVMDIKGTCILLNKHRITGTRQLELNLSGLPVGQYIVLVQTGTGKKTFRFIKQ
ncbi:MAG: Ig-like domain-containing protein [Agriterribacter sp.]